MKDEKTLEMYFDKKEGVWKEHEEPFAVIECPTEEDYLRFQEMVAFWNEHHKNEV